MAWNNTPNHHHTTQHQRWARQILRRDNYLCQHCAHQGHPHDKNMQADHILNIKSGGHPTDLNNGQTLCKPCHAQKTAHEATQARRDRNAPRTPMKHPALG
ncbi:HNH endonuclease [Rhodococcus erythropolis]|uniref:HNH endonuclease n=1 Tax=Rhodococcus erythropolis TaxID=1833 RepID=UPI001BE903D2|nr:HNH endonuclease [Rhodococcus erythropolis]